MTGTQGALGGMFTAAGIGENIWGYGLLQHNKKTNNPVNLQKRAAEGRLYAGLETLYPWLQTEQQLQPGWLSLGSSNLDQVLFGNPSRDYSVDVPVYSPSGRLKSTTTLKGTIPGSRGLLDIAGEAAPRLEDLYNTSARRSIGNNLGLLNQYLPGAQDYYNATDPQLAALRSGVMGSAQRGLALGDRVDPETAARIARGVRGDWASRGLGASNPAQLEEALSLYGAGENLRASREAGARSSLGLLEQTRPDYTQFLLSLGGTNPVGQALNLTTGQQPLSYREMYDPFGGSNLAATGAGIEERNIMARANQHFDWGNQFMQAAGYGFGGGSQSPSMFSGGGGGGGGAGSLYQWGGTANGFDY